jgi:hypothetical protein
MQPREPNGASTPRPWHMSGMGPAVRRVNMQGARPYVDEANVRTPGGCRLKLPQPHHRQLPHQTRLQALALFRFQDLYWKYPRR